jgi:hypothetical protein
MRNTNHSLSNLSCSNRADHAAVQSRTCQELAFNPTVSPEGLGVDDLAIASDDMTTASEVHQRLLLTRMRYAVIVSISIVSTRAPARVLKERLVLLVITSRLTFAEQTMTI